MPFSVYIACRKTYKQRTVIVLCFCIERGAVSADLSAFLAAVYDYKSVLCVGLGAYGAHQSAALVCSVAWVYINVERAKAKGTVVSRAASHRKNLAAAVGAHEGIIVFRKSFLFHIICLKLPFRSLRA